MILGARMDKQILKCKSALAEWFKPEIGVIALDTESESLDYLTGGLVGISLYDGKRVCYIDLHDNPEFVEMINFLIEEIQKLEGVFFWNAAYDIRVLQKYGFTIPENFYDGMVGQHLLDENGSKSLKNNAQYYLGVKETLSWEQAIDRGFHSKKFYNYAMHDAEWTWQIAQLQIPQLHAQGLWDLWWAVERPFQFCLAEMEANGVLIDQEKLSELNEELLQKISELQLQMYEAGNIDYYRQLLIDGTDEIIPSVNLNSSQQLIKVIQKLGVGLTEKTEGGQLSTKETVLEKIKHQHKFIELLLEYRGAFKFWSSFTNKLPKHINSDGRIRTHFHPARVVTGRLSSTDPPMQTLPRKGTGLVDIRQCIIAPKGKVILALDFAGQEIRIMAEESQDPELLRYFKEGLDLHQEIADKMVIDRSRAKTITFGVAYGKSALGFAADWNVPIKEAQKFIDNYFAAFPRLKDRIVRCNQELATLGYVTNLAGRRRRINQPTKRAFRQSFNFLIQSMGGEQMKAAAALIQYNAWERWDLRAVLSIHDELVFEINEQYVEEAMPRIKHWAEAAYPLSSVENVVEINYGKNYSLAKM